MTTLVTKNLYIKEEVECALLSAVLRNEKEIAIFWFLELFNSGYQEEVVDYLWTIHYSFHAPINPSFEKYMIRKLSDSDASTRVLTLTTIITNLCNKPYTTDVYALMNSASTSSNDSFCEEWFSKKDYKSIANYIMSDKFDGLEKNMDKIRNAAMKSCRIKWYRPMLLPSPKICLKLRFLSHIMQICSTQVYEIPKKNRLNLSSKHICVSLENLPREPRNVLKNACKFSVNCSSTLHLFKLTRHEDKNIDIKKCYRDDWLYHCSGTPYWREKIRECSGTVNVEQKTVEFNNAEDEEAFFKEHSLEPDEQPQEVQEKSIRDIPEFEGEDVIVEFKKMFGKWDICV